jgi:hypothetical protein
MAKKRLLALAKEYDISFEEIMEIASKTLEESSLTGKGKNTWVNENGQTILDDCIPIKDVGPRMYRGRVRNACPNPIYVQVHIPEKAGCVKVRVPRKWARTNWVNRIVNVIEQEDDIYELHVPSVY